MEAGPHLEAAPCACCVLSSALGMATSLSVFKRLKLRYHFQEKKFTDFLSPSPTTPGWVRGDRLASQDKWSRETETGG